MKATTVLPATGLLILLANSAEAQQSEAYSKVGRWVVVRHRPGLCVAHIQSSKEEMLSARAASPDSIDLAVTNTRYDIPPGSYPISFTFGGALQTITTKNVEARVLPGDRSTLIITLPSSVEPTLDRSSWMRFDVGSHRHFFNFEDFASAMRATVMCASVAGGDPFKFKN